MYDENNQPYAMRYNGTVYYYVLNVQGDVVGLLNANGATAVEYTYDPWGKLLNINTHGSTPTMDVQYSTAAEANPLRYRGYIYDSDTGLYYLQSRYYDPAIGRFINADEFVTTDVVNLLGSNMFAYCINNPVNFVDFNGYNPIAISATWGSTMWWLTLADGALPIGDIIYFFGCAVAAGAVLSQSIPTTIKAQNKASNDAKDKYYNQQIVDMGSSTAVRRQTIHMKEIGKK